jgi:hypothetical protein
MNADLHKQNRFIRFTGIVGLIIFGFLSILGSGGGGDDGGDGGISVGLLTTYDFNIGRGYDSSGTESDGMTVTVSSIPATVRVDPHSVTGTFNCNPATYICAPSTVNIGTVIDLFDESGAPVVGNLSITIPVQLIMGSSGKPDSGTIRITLVPAGDFIELETTSCTGGAGVNISYNGVPVSPSSCFTWDDFEQLIDTSSDPVLIAAVFGYQVIEFMFEQVHFTTEVLGIIDDYAADLEEYYGIYENCDSFSAAGFIAPSEVASDPGIRDLYWSDVNTDGNLGPGDSFYADLYDCWISPDQLLNGYVEFTGYVENIDQTRGVITAIGFTSVTPPTPGGVFFPYFSISETEETTTGIMEITNVIGVEGGFSILFNEPAP